MADGRHIENRLLVIYQRVIIGLTRNFAGWSRITFQHRTHDQNAKFRKFKMAVGHHFVNGFIIISQRASFNFNLVCSRKLRFQGRSHNKVPQFCKFNTVDGGHNENRFSAISRRFTVWLTRNFVRRSRITLRHRLCRHRRSAIMSAGRCLYACI